MSDNTKTGGKEDRSTMKVTGRDCHYRSLDYGDVRGEKLTECHTSCLPPTENIMGLHVYTCDTLSQAKAVQSGACTDLMKLTPASVLCTALAVGST